MWMKILILLLTLICITLLLTWEQPVPDKEALRKDSLMNEAKKLLIY